MSIRIGQGFDMHPFAEGRKLVLGGIEISSDRGLVGHSDADALTHAICDALLGSLALGDMGEHFPDTADTNKNRPSLEFLHHVGEMIRERNWKIENIDTTIVTEVPKIAPHIEAMRGKIANTLEVDPAQVSIKATRPEKLGALGRQEGILVLASALVSN